MNAETRAHIQQVAEAWPQLTREQIDRVTTIIQGQDA